MQERRFPGEQKVRSDLGKVLEEHRKDNEYQVQLRTKIPLEKLPKRHVISVDKETYNKLRNRVYYLQSLGKETSLIKTVDAFFQDNPPPNYVQRPADADHYAFLWEQEHSKIVDIEPFLNKKEAEKAFKKAQSMEEYEEVLKRLKASSF